MIRRISDCLAGDFFLSGSPDKTNVWFHYRKNKVRVVENIRSFYQLKEKHAVKAAWHFPSEIRGDIFMLSHYYQHIVTHFNV